MLLGTNGVVSKLTPMKLHPKYATAPLLTFILACSRRNSFKLGLDVIVYKFVQLNNSNTFS